jgi:hypothetical protein
MQLELWGVTRGNAPCELRHIIGMHGRPWTLSMVMPTGACGVIGQGWLHCVRNCCISGFSFEGNVIGGMGLRH